MRAVYKIVPDKSTISRESSAYSIYVFLGDLKFKGQLNLHFIYKNMSNLNIKVPKTIQFYLILVSFNAKCYEKSNYIK